MTRRAVVLVGLLLPILLPSPSGASVPGGDARLTNDNGANGGYVSNYTMVTGTPSTDSVLTECSASKGRQDEPAVAVDPRDTHVIVGSSNDYCGVFQGDNPPQPTGPVWLGYYRSENSGQSFQSSLVPGYPGDGTPYASRAHVRTASAGDPVLAWDSHGRLFAGSESSGAPDGSPKGFGDEWVATYQNPGGPNPSTLNDGKEFVGSVTVASGSSAPGLGGKFNDKTAIEVDRTGGPCDGYVYFAWSRFTGSPQNGYNATIYIVRSTDHGATFSSPMKLSQTVHDLQNPDIAVTGDGHVYVVYRAFASQVAQEPSDAIVYNASTDCGATFGQPRQITTFEPYDAVDLFSDGSTTGECGDAPEDCQSGYTFFRHTTQVRATADQTDGAHDYVYIVYDPSRPGSEVATGTTYGTIVSGDLPAKYHKAVGSQEAVYFTRLNAATGTHTDPALIDPQATGHQLFPDISADGGQLHAIWWDSRNDPCYAPTRPIGNCADRSTVDSLDAWGATAPASTLAWTGHARLSDESSNPNFEQFSGRTVPFQGDYLYVSSVGSFSYGTWTDQRDTAPGTDPRESASDGDGPTADVLQCRAAKADGTFGPDTCPRAGGLDQNVYGDLTP